MGRSAPVSQEQFTLALIVNSGKWLLQIGLAYSLLKKRRASFIHGLAKNYLISSLFFIPFILSSFLGLNSDPLFFIGSLVLAGFAMTYLYFEEVKRLNLSIGWWYFWIFSILISVAIQTLYVFKVF